MNNSQLFFDYNSDLLKVHNTYKIVDVDLCLRIIRALLSRTSNVYLGFSGVRHHARHIIVKSSSQINIISERVEHIAYITDYVDIPFRISEIVKRSNVIE